MPDGSDAPAADRDISKDGRIARAVHHTSAAQEEVEILRARKGGSSTEADANKEGESHACFIGERARRVEHSLRAGEPPAVGLSLRKSPYRGELASPVRENYFRPVSTHEPVFRVRPRRRF